MTRRGRRGPGIIGLADSLLPECAPPAPPHMGISLELIKSCGTRCAPTHAGGAAGAG